MSYSLEAAPPADAPAPARNPFEIKSLGADGEPDGEGAAADLLFSQQKPLKSSEIPKSTESRGLQQQMASSSGWSFNSMRWITPSPTGGPATCRWTRSKIECRAGLEKAVRAERLKNCSKCSMEAAFRQVLSRWSSES